MNSHSEVLSGQIRNLLLEAQQEGSGQKELRKILLAAADGLGIFPASENGRVVQDYDKETGAYSLEYAMLLLQQICVQEDAGLYEGVSFNITGMTIFNNRFGMENGSRIIHAYLDRLKDVIGKDGFTGRIGGDRFFAVYRREKRNDVIAFVKGADLKVPRVTDKSIHVSSIAGFMEIESGMDASTVLDGINAARRIAKYQTNTTFLFYDDEIRRKLSNDRSVELMFSPALQNEEFQVYYQPKVELRRYHLYGAEALCRWFHNGKMIMPGDFIPVLEQNGAICELDCYILEHVCRDIRGWMEEGRKTVCISVNLSRCNLGDPALLDRIIGILEKYQIPAGAVEIEITETATEVSFLELQKLVRGLRDAGIPCSLDDFGAGYSSMNTLSEIPWNYIKIDRSLVPAGDDDAEDEKRKILLKGVVSLAQSLGISCITEGVETLKQSVFLKSVGCYLAQGFFFDRPMPKESFVERLTAADKGFTKGPR